MKAAPFDYVRAENLAHALDKLSESGGDAKLIAGGPNLEHIVAIGVDWTALSHTTNQLG